MGNVRSWGVISIRRLSAVVGILQSLPWRIIRIDITGFFQYGFGIQSKTSLIEFNSYFSSNSLIFALSFMCVFTEEEDEIEMKVRRSKGSG